MIWVAQYMGVSWPVSRTIVWWTGFPYSHSSLYFEDTDKEFAAWQRGGCHWSPGIGHDHTKGTIVDLYPWRIDGEDVEKVRQFCNSTDGMPYDFPGIFSFMFHRDFSRDDAYFCCEHVIEAGQLTKMPILYGKPSKYYPGHVSGSPALGRDFVRKVV